MNVAADPSAAAPTRHPRLSVTVLTGFLGAGKTTALNAFLGSADAAGIAVLVNEFGTIDVDGAVLSGHLSEGSALVSLPNGCICCAVQEDLAEALLALASDRPDIQRCVIETTGLADPGAILRGLQHDPRLRKVALAKLTVTVCAADRLADQLTRFSEPARQIAIADRILLSKTDLVTVKAAAKIEAQIANLNPLAEIVTRLTDAFAPVTATHPPNLNLTITTIPGGITSFTIPLARPLDPDRFRDTMSFLIMRHADDLLRLKGVVRFGDDPVPQLLNVVHDVYSATPLHGAATGTGLVIIGEGLPEQEICRDLQACQIAPSQIPVTDQIKQ